MKIFSLLITFCFLGFCCNTPSEKMSSASLELPTEKMKGLSFVAPSNPFSDNPMERINAVGADWIAVTPFGFSPNDEPMVRFNTSRQWWGERAEGTIETIRLAKESNIKVLLKPHVWMHGSWIGDLDFDHETDWGKWESDYTDYILTYAKIADSLNVEVFCIGTEVKQSVKKREKYWRGLIRAVKKIYDGKLTYASNWDAYQMVPFWDELDYVGIDTYFPLVKSKTPTIEELKKAWQPTVKELRKFHRKTGKPIVFTEYGYMSIDGCAHKNWELENQRTEIPVNQQAQANAIEALFEVFWKEDWWGGGFLWKWYPNYRGEGQGRRAKFRAADYTPQGKIAEEVLKDWFKGIKSK
jgi:hypothetical protein